MHSCVRVYVHACVRTRVRAYRTMCIVYTNVCVCGCLGSCMCVCVCQVFATETGVLLQTVFAHRAVVTALGIPTNYHM